MRRADFLQKTLMMGKIEGRRRREQQRMRWLHGISNSMDMNLSKLQGIVKHASPACCSPWGGKESDRTDSLTEQWQLGEHGLKKYT